MTIEKLPWLEWEVSELLRKVAEGKTNKEISFDMHRSSKSIRSKLNNLKVSCNLPASHVNRVWLGQDYTEKTPRDRWFVKVTFENVTKDEARQISADAPKSAPFRKQNIHWSIYGNPMAEMIA